MRRLRAAVPIAVALIGLLLWWRSPVQTTNILLITLDTTRADRLTPYGFMDASMPALERLAREGVVFDQAETVAPLTLPAHASILTGLFPASHGVRSNAGPPLAAGYATLTEMLHARGYRTGAFVSSVVLSSDRGLAQGFDRYGGVPDPEETAGRQLQRAADAVVADTLDWLATIHDGPWFAWAHLYDPHRPYDPPEPYRSRHFDPYVGEIAFADAQIGRMLAALEVNGQLDDTIVIVAGDHGESLGDHGEAGHGRTLYESVLRVPLIVRVPLSATSRIARGSRVGSVVRLVDIVPTVLALLELPLPQSDGVSLISRLRGQREADLEAYAETTYPVQFGEAMLASLRADRFKIIASAAGAFNLYDLQNDPFERQDRSHEHPSTAVAMLQRLGAIACRLPAASPVPVPARGRLHADLLSLGYLSINPAVPAWSQCVN
jgi:arylsulfatase A-like enzyme